MTLTNRELATVLAALRYRQNDLDDAALTAGFEDYFMDAEPLSPVEIDSLCERLKTGESPHCSEASAPDALTSTVQANHLHRFYCQDCDFETSDIEFLEPIDDITERVEPGEVMPAGECPECGALCQMRSDAEMARYAPPPFVTRITQEARPQRQTVIAPPAGTHGMIEALQLALTQFEQMESLCPDDTEFWEAYAAVKQELINAGVHHE